VASVAVGGGLLIASLAQGFNFRSLSYALRRVEEYNSSHR
jgi:hypothetical protein